MVCCNPQLITISQLIAKLQNTRSNIVTCNKFNQVWWMTRDRRPRPGGKNALLPAIHQWPPCIFHNASNSDAQQRNTHHKIHPSPITPRNFESSSTDSFRLHSVRSPVSLWSLSAQNKTSSKLHNLRSRVAVLDPNLATTVVQESTYPICRHKKTPEKAASARLTHYAILVALTAPKLPKTCSKFL